MLSIPITKQTITTNN